MQASNRTNELDVNSVVTRETFKCGECGKVTSFEVFRVPEYTRNGQTALSRNVKYSDGTMMDGVGKGDCMDGVPGKDAYCRAAMAASIAFAIAFTSACSASVFP